MSHHGKHEHCHSQSGADPHECPEALAYHLWEQAGRPEGQAERFWLDAEEQINRSHRPVAAASR